MNYIKFFSLGEKLLNKMLAFVIEFNGLLVEKLKNIYEQL